MTTRPDLAPLLSDAVKARFWSKVKRDGECWNWTATTTKAGYGRFQLGGCAWPATHVALTLCGAPRPDKGQALHSCDNARCVNPGHLRWGTHDDNMTDKIERNRCSRLVGTRNPNAMPVTDETIRLKTLILTSPKSDRVLARELGKAKTLILEIRHGLKWRHVPPIVERGDHRSKPA